MAFRSQLLQRLSFAHQWMALRQGSVYTSRPTIKLDYKPLPRKNGLIVDWRNDRQVLDDSYKPRKAKDFNIKFELLDDNDIEPMTQFATEYWVKQLNITKCLNMPCEEFIELMAPLTEKWLKCKNSIVVKKDDKVVGIALHSHLGRDKFEEAYNGQLFHDNPKLEFKHDYAEEISNLPFKSRNTSRVAYFLHELEWQTGKFLPKDTQRLGFLELVISDPNFRRLGLNTRACELARKILNEQGCDYELAYCVAKGSTKMCTLYGHHIAWSYPYDKFRENGKVVFNNLYDGALASNTTFGSVKELYARDQKRAAEAKLQTGIKKSKKAAGSGRKK